MARLFGTDGVRGVANTELTCELAYRLGQAAVTFMGKAIVVGKDTRLSGDMLEAAMVAGITSAGGTALLAGIIPTPEYNGIKLFDAQGFKLPDEVEDRIECFVKAGGLEGVIALTNSEDLGEGVPEAAMPSGPELGVAVEVEEACEMYIEHAVSSIRSQGMDFTGMTIALDTGHGASSLTSPAALRRLGAEVIVINDDFDGNDINVNCGSPEVKRSTVTLWRRSARWT